MGGADAWVEFASCMQDLAAFDQSLQLVSRSQTLTQKESGSARLPCSRKFCASFVLQVTKACSDGVGSLDSHLLSNKASHLIALVAVPPFTPAQWRSQITDDARALRALFFFFPLVGGGGSGGTGGMLP